jgi:serine/threonine protein kinase
MPNVSTGGGDPAQPPEPGDGRLLARRYRLLTVVGHGGMGTVWHAHDEVLGRDVAVKEVILPHGMSQDEREVHHKRTFREARTAARLAHPGVVTVFDVVEEGGRPWIIMELIKAPSLDQVIKDKGRLPPRRAAQIAREMLGALHTAHEAGVLHRDVKPSNVLVAPGDRVVLTDFGIATAAGDVTLTQTGLVMGSPAYIAPERARGRTAGPASDLWALGVTLYAMVEGGASPYDRSEPMASLIAVISEDPEPPVHAGPVRPIIEGLLRKDPEARLSALEAGAMLDQVVRGLAMTRRNTLPLTQVSDDAAPTSVLDTEPAGGDRPQSPAEPPAPSRTDSGDGTGDEAGEDAGSGPSAPPAAATAAESPAAESPAVDTPPAETPVADSPTRSPAASPATDETPTDPAEPAAPTSVEPIAGRAAAAAPGVEGIGQAVAPPGAAPPTVPAGASTAPPGGPVRGSAGGRTALVITAIALGAVLILGVWAWISQNNDDPAGPAQPTGRQASPSASASATQGGSRSASPGVAAGFQRHSDPTGFSIDVPANWTGPERRSAGSVFFYAPDRRSYVQIDQTDNPNSSALADWRSQDRGAPGRFSNYRRLRLEPTGDHPPVPDTGDGSKSADWEFTWGSGSAAKHVLDRGFVTTGHGYAILVSAPASDWAATIDRLQPVFASFRPAK